MTNTFIIAIFCQTENDTISFLINLLYIQIGTTHDKTKYVSNHKHIFFTVTTVSVYVFAKRLLLVSAAIILFESDNREGTVNDKRITDITYDYFSHKQTINTYLDECYLANIYNNLTFRGHAP